MSRRTVYRIHWWSPGLRRAGSAGTARRCMYARRGLDIPKNRLQAIFYPASCFSPKLPHKSGIFLHFS
jgi:hypothetical protein